MGEANYKSGIQLKLVIWISTLVQNQIDLLTQWFPHCYIVFS